MNKWSHLWEELRLVFTFPPRMNYSSSQWKRLRILTKVIEVTRTSAVQSLQTNHQAFAELVKANLQYLRGELVCWWVPRNQHPQPCGSGHLWESHIKNFWFILNFPIFTFIWKSPWPTKSVAKWPSWPMPVKPLTQKEGTETLVSAVMLIHGWVYKTRDVCHWWRGVEAANKEYHVINKLMIKNWTAISRSPVLCRSVDSKRLQDRNEDVMTGVMTHEWSAMYTMPLTTLWQTGAS